MPRNEAVMVYDGECPFCSNYVKLIRLREAIGPVRLVDARGGGPEVERLQRLGFDLNEGMALQLNGEIYYGADCIHRISLLSSPSTLFNKLNAWVFRSRTASRLLYPAMRAGRNLTLAILGRPKLPDHVGAD
jgi:predicted DCC family thiol-disulfide oxidoreductase YuxK